MARGALLLASFLTGCSASEETRSTADTATYMLRDTAAYANAVSGGDYAVLLRNGEVIDSIDLYFGLQHLNTGASVFLPVESYPEPDIVEEGVAAMDITKHLVYDGNRRDTLALILPHFDDRFSSPSIVGGVLYYWGIQRDPVTDLRKIRAVRYDAAARRIQSHSLFETELATDNRTYFAPPKAVAGTIAFDAGERAFYASPDFRRVDSIPPALAGIIQSARDSAQAKAAARASRPKNQGSRQP